MRKPKNWEIVTMLREEFKNHCDQFLVTGGVALDIYGLVNSDEVHDVDLIIVNPDHKALDKLTLLQTVSGIKGRTDYMTELNKNLYRFEIKGASVDVFVEDVVKENALWYDYVRVNPILDIFNAKKRMNRKKDWAFVIDMVKLICTWPEPLMANISGTTRTRPVGENGHHIEAE